MSRLFTARFLSGLLAALLVLQAAPALAEPEVYFSPNGGIRDRLLRAINLTKATIDLAIFDFTSGELAGALLAAKERGVTIRIVADARQAQGKHSEIPLLLEKGMKVRLVRGNGRGIMHHKFAIFDGKLLVTGSYNWTDAAERLNHENAFVLRDPDVIARYQARFEELLNSGLTLSLRRRG
ncbi:MAG: phospholipase D-like domain-containing protein [Candidatus Rokuibacteriota bacterium]